MNYVISTLKKDNFKFKEIIKNKLYLYFSTSYSHSCDFYLDGYLKLKNEKITKEAIKQLQKNWPLENQFSGSYSFTTITKNKIIIANDCIGIYPIYYCYDNQNITISNNLYLLQKLLHCDIDEIGKIQRMFSLENSEIGNRTVLKDVKRLLPGEQIIFDLNKQNKTCLYDNRLYSNISNDLSDDSINKYWDILKSEIDFISSMDNSDTHIALSGGMDSRLLLGAMNKNKNTIAFNYGKSDFYETKIAKKLAKKLGFKFKNSLKYENQFPSSKKLIKTIKKVGVPYVMSWYDVFELADKKIDKILLGDMCESLHARNIKKYSSRESRVKNYFNKYLLNKDYKFEDSSFEKFKLWKDNVINKYLKKIFNGLEKNNVNFNKSKIKNEVVADLSQIFDRIAQHKLPFTELYDELFNWYTHARLPMGKQILHCNERFKSYCPPMSSSVLIRTSNIHPNLRLNYRFMNKLFKNIKPLNNLNTIPTNQAPLISRNAPESLQFLIWGVRSKIDQFLIRKIMKSKNKQSRYRIFKSLNWVKAYQIDNLERTIKSYFYYEKIPSKLIDKCLNIALSRRKLESWPLSNTDIISLSTLNIELKILEEA